MNTHESYVSLAAAKLLKQAGFNWAVTHYYKEIVHGTRLLTVNYGLETIIDKEHNIYEYPAPTLAVAQRWLREEKNISVDAYGEWQGLAKLFTYGILILCPAHKPRKMWIGDDKNNITDFPTYEAALEEGIVKCLKELI